MPSKPAYLTDFEAWMKSFSDAAWEDVNVQQAFEAGFAAGQRNHRPKEEQMPNCISNPTLDKLILRFHRAEDEGVRDAGDILSALLELRRARGKLAEFTESTRKTQVVKRAASKP